MQVLCILIYLSILLLTCYPPPIIIIMYVMCSYPYSVCVPIKNSKHRHDPVLCCLIPELDKIASFNRTHTSCRRPILFSLVKSITFLSKCFKIIGSRQMFWTYVHGIISSESCKNKNVSLIWWWMDLKICWIIIYAFAISVRRVFFYYLIIILFSWVHRHLSPLGVIYCSQFTWLQLISVFAEMSSRLILACLR